ncbi:hypothetical protein BsWGS_16411 [Bradybaena similaris]
MKCVENRYILSLIGIVSVVQTLAQICPYNNTKCVCYDRYVTCTGLQEIPPLVTGIDVTYFTTVNFQDGNIVNVPSSNLPPGLEKLTFSGHPLTNWSDDAFDKSEASIYLLNITGAKFQQLPRAFLKLTSLSRLVIADTPVQIWEGPVLQHIATILPDLELINVGFTAWPKWLSHFHSLNILYLSNNCITTIPEDAFSVVTNTLTRIILENTCLTHVPQALATLSNLTNLDLSSNIFTDEYEVETLASMPLGTTLSDLTIEYIGLSKMLNFSKMKNLFAINLNFNEISDATSGLFPSFITSLYVQGNQLSLVPTDVAKMSTLYSLFLSDNKITTIEPVSFPPNLGYLDLSFNKLIVITDTYFTNLTVMETLYLNNNPISTISSLAFEDLTSLITLDISNTYFVQVPAALISLTTVLEIDMANPSLTCPCPADSALVKWFAHGGGKISLSGNCCTGQSIQSYLSGQCTTSFTTPATCLAATTQSNDALMHAQGLVCGCGSFLLLAVLWILL